MKFCNAGSNHIMNWPLFSPATLAGPGRLKDSLKRMLMSEIEIITDRGCRRRWSATDHLRIVEETLFEGESLSAVARRNGVAPDLVYRWRRLMPEGGSIAVSEDDSVTGNKAVRDREARIRELERRPGRKTLENEILREALEKSRAKKTDLFTPVKSPQANGMLEAFVKTLKRDYVRVNPLPDAQTGLSLTGAWIEDYNENQPHSGLKWKSPREFIRVKIETASVPAETGASSMSEWRMT